MRHLFVMVLIGLVTGVNVNAQELPEKCEHKNSPRKYQYRHGDIWRCYANGHWKSAERYKFGKGQGMFTYWWPTGHKKSEGPYLNAVKHGLFTHWESDGVKTAEVFWRKGEVRNMRKWNTLGRLIEAHDYKKATGKYMSTYYNDKGKKTGHGESVLMKKKSKNIGFKNSGYWTYWKNGKKYLAGHKKGDRLLGVVDIWHNDDTHCQFKAARRGGTEHMLCSYPSGEKKSEGPIDHKYQQTGEWLFYKKNGTLKAKGSYKKDQKHGTWYGYHKDGYLTMKMKYGNQVGKSVWHQKDGSKASFTAKKIKKNASSAKIVKTGVFNQWYPNGKLRSIETYRNGVKDGPYSKYYDNGQESQKGIFERDKRVGLWVLWNENGTKDKELFFRDGEIAIFTQFVWYDNGQMHYMEKRVTGDLTETKQLETETIFWFANGSKDRHLFRIDGKLDGLQKSYYTSGTLRKKEQYKKGLSQDQYVLFYPDGSKALEKRNPSKQGVDPEAVYWDEHGTKVAESYRDTNDEIKFKYYGEPQNVEKVLQRVGQIKNSSLPSVEQKIKSEIL